MLQDCKSKDIKQRSKDGRGHLPCRHRPLRHSRTRPAQAPPCRQLVQHNAVTAARTPLCRLSKRLMLLIRFTKGR